jgi:hypothetical protein
MYIQGGDYYYDGWVGDCTEAVFCMPLVAVQEAREIEIRTRRKWTWLRGMCIYVLYYACIYVTTSVYRFVCVVYVRDCFGDIFKR